MDDGRMGSTWLIRVRRGGLLAVMATALLGGVAGCGGGDDHAAGAPASMARPPAAVTAVPAISRDVPVYLEEIGRTVATDIVSVVPQVDGKIIAAHVEDGADVKKGQLLFEIDPRPFQASLASAQALVAQTKAELELAKIEFRRAEDLISKSAISQLEYDQRKNDVAVAEAKISAAEAAEETAQLNLNYTKIVSPIEGRAGAVLVDAGNVVKANDAPLLNLQSLDPIYAEFSITENDLGTVRKYISAQGLDLGLHPEQGLRVEVDVPGDSNQVLSALGAASATTAPSTQPIRGGPREGTLTFLDNAVQDASGRVRLRAKLPNADHYFWPGQFVNVRLVLAIKKNAVLVPTRAQQIGQDGPYVFVVHPGTVKDPATGKETSGTVASLRPIVPGQRQGDMLVIKKGIETGEQVITQGHMNVMPGGLVQIIPPQGSASGGSPAGNTGASGASAGGAEKGPAGAGAGSGEASETKS